MRTTLPVALLTLLIAGCQTPLLKPAPVPIDPAAVQLDAALQTTTTARVLGPETIAPTPIYTPAVTVSYLGDSRILLGEVAKANGMTFTVSGPMPQLPIFVQINVKEVPLEAFLEQVARQLSQRADVVIRNGRKTLELRYRGGN
jgi:hypothetical protein